MRGLRRLSQALFVLAALCGLCPPLAAEGPAYLVKDLTEGMEPGVSSSPHGYVDLGGVVVFVARDDAHGNELWRTDGTAAGTIRLTDLAPGHADGVIGPARAVHAGMLYFSGPDGVWRSDGTAAGTQRVSDLAATHLAIAHGALYVFGGAQYGGQYGDDWTALWRVALAGGTATHLRDFPLGVAAPGNVHPSPAAIGTRLYFAAADTTFGEGLWVTDGTPGGTRPIAALQLANRDGGNESTALIAAGDQLFFVARDEAGWEPWRSDGTEAGTRRLRDINPGPRNGIHFNDYLEAAQPFFAAVGETVFFVATDGTSGLELWRSDGSAAGTRQVAEVAPGALGLDGTAGGDDRSDAAQAAIRMLPAPGRLYFTARPSGVAAELWESDGTAAGTRLVVALGSEWEWLGGAAIADTPDATGATLYLASGPGLWASDGTAAGTAQIAALPGHPSGLTPVAGGVIFTLDDGLRGAEPWVSDGTAAGTRPLADLARGNPGLDPGELTDLNGVLLFAGQDEVHGRELWRSDGSAAGTTLVADLAPGPGSSHPQNLVASGATLYFSADDGVQGRALWRSDGTAAGTALLRASAGRSDRFHLLPDGRGGVWFLMGRPEHPHALWHSDGSAAGTRLVHALHHGTEGSLRESHPWAVLGDTLLFGAWDPHVGNELWRSDGTSAGTALVADLYPGETGSWPRALTPVGDAVLFVAAEAAQQRSLWRSDGTAAGTQRIATVDHVLGTPAVGADGRILFATRSASAFSTVHRLWQSDGTSTGTFRLDVPAFANPTTVAAGNGLFALLGSVPHRLYRLDCGTLLASHAPLAELAGLGDRLLFTARYGDHGRELWTSDGTAAGTMAVQVLSGPPPDGRYRPAEALQFTRSGALVFFAGEHDGAGRELWALPVAALPVADAPPCPPPPTPTARPSGPLDCPGGAAACTALALDVVRAQSGETVTIAATLLASEVPIAGIQNELTFVEGIAVAARADGRPDCTVAPEIDKPASGFAFAPSGCTPGETCTGVRALVLSVTDVDPIPDRSLLYTCTVAVSPEAAPGVYPLALSDTLASDSDGNAIALQPIAGAVEVREHSGSQPAVSATAGDGCQTTTAGGPATPLAALLTALLLLRRRRARPR